MAEKKISEYKKIARQKLSGRYGMAIGLLIIFWVVYGAINGGVSLIGGTLSFIFEKPYGGAVTTNLIAIAAGALLIAIQVGFKLFYLMVARGWDYEVSDLFIAFTADNAPLRLFYLWLSNILEGLLYAVCMLPAIICFVLAGVGGISNEAVVTGDGLQLALTGLGMIFYIAGLILMLRFVMAFSMKYYIIADHLEKDESEVLGPVELLQYSSDIMYGNKMKLFGLYFSFIGWFFLGMITCGIGFLWIIPYFNAATACFYEDVKLTGTEGGVVLEKAPVADVNAGTEEAEDIKEAAAPEKMTDTAEAILEIKEDAITAIEAEPSEDTAGQVTDGQDTDGSGI